MRFGSVCSGIEAASVAWGPLGWEAAWFSEIEPFPCAVLAHHYPDVPNLGDMTALPDRILSGEVEAPDLFCGGTPCQAFSVAGLRKSLGDARGNLSLTFCEIANAIDSVRSARREPACVIFWENVPGVLSTKDNAFGCFLAGIAGESEPLKPPGGKWTNAGAVFGPTRAVAWRVLDAQYFGVAQRRKRVFVVASAREGFDPAAVLFEFDSVRRDSAPSRETGEKPAGTFTARANSGGGFSTDFECDGGVVQQPTWWDGKDVAATITTKSDDQRMPDKANAQLVMQPVNIYGGNKRADRPEGGFYVRMDEDTSKTLDAASGLNPTCSQGGTAVMQPVAFHPTQDPINSTDVCHAIGANDNATAAVATPINTQMALRGAETSNTSREGIGVGEPGDPAFTLQAAHHHAVATAMQVRRLTPIECERLQGFPDNYTAIPWRNKPADQCPDGPRYKALGNSWAVPVVRWIGQRIACSIANQWGKQ